MEMILNILNVAGGIVAGLLTLAIYELLRVLTGRKVDVTVETLRRRIADLEALRRRDGCRVPPAGWECTREPGHDGPCAAVPSMVHKHLGDPPYSDEERAVDRAYAEAGIMPVGEYVAKHGGHP